MSIKRDSDLFKKVVKNYWEYYRELEDEFLLTRRYVDFTENNFATYSVEYLKLYQAVCSEIDVIGKAMAQVVDPSFKPEDKQNNILKWWFKIQNEYLLTDGPFTPLNPTAQVVRINMGDYKCILLGNHDFVPWANFKTESRINTKNAVYYATAEGSDTPSWWKAYNAVKHNRISIGSAMTNYEKANLGNLAFAFSGLYVLEKAFMDSVGCEDDLQSFLDFSRLFVKPRRLTNSEMDEWFKSV